MSKEVERVRKEYDDGKVDRKIFQTWIALFMGIVFAIMTNLLIGGIIGVIVFIIADNSMYLEYEYYIDENGEEVIIREIKKGFSDFFRL